jgi:methanogenic corrinoid protein MtbC1
MSLPSIYLDLLAPAARMLGAMWDEDRCSFADVTVAVSRMHQVLLHFSPCFCANVAESTENAHRALIVPVPGEQHTFGLFMVVEFFRRAGWNIWSGSPATPSDLFGVVSANAFELLGYSVAADRHLGQLKEQLSAIRKRSRNPNIKILVGGQAFSDDPELFREVGADASAADGMQAVQVAERLVQRT